MRIAIADRCNEFIPAMFRSIRRSAVLVLSIKYQDAQVCASLGITDASACSTTSLGLVLSTAPKSRTPSAVLGSASSASAHPNGLAKHDLRQRLPIPRRLVSPLPQWVTATDWQGCQGGCPDAFVRQRIAPRRFSISWTRRRPIPLRAACVAFSKAWFSKKSTIEYAAKCHDLVHGCEPDRAGQRRQVIICGNIRRAQPCPKKPRWSARGSLAPVWFAVVVNPHDIGHHSAEIGVQCHCAAAQRSNPASSGPYFKPPAPSMDAPKPHVGFNHGHVQFFEPECG